MKSIPLVRKFLGLVEMISGLVNATFNLPEWQAVKMIFFAPCVTYSIARHTIEGLINQVSNVQVN